MIRFVLIGVLLALPTTSFALGLGAIEVNSSLNQKFDADVELLSAMPVELDSIIVKLASRQAFKRAGIDRPYQLSELNFKATLLNGNPYIKITSKNPIKEPFLNFLLEIDWPKGHLLREYTVLLDPPSFMLQQPAPAVTTNNDFSDTTNDVVEQTNAPVDDVAQPQINDSFSGETNSGETNQASDYAETETDSTVTSTSSYQPAAPRTTSVTNDYITVAGDTAWDLAKAMRPNENVNIAQMMMALLRANPDAFIKGNINGLKKGVVLRVPDYEEITSISTKKAEAASREQTALWQEYKHSQSGKQLASAMESDGQSSSGTSSSNTGEDARLEIVSAGSGGSAQSSKDPSTMTEQELRADLALAKERVETERVKKEGLQERIATLEKNIVKMQGLMTFEENELANAQSLGMKIEGDNTSDIADEPDTSEAGATEDVGFDGEEKVAEDETEKTDVSEEAEQIAQSDDSADDSATEETQTTDTEQTSTDDSFEESRDTNESVTPANNFSQAKGFIETLLEDKILVAGLAGVLVVLLALLGFFIKKRRSSDDESEIMDSDFDNFDSDEVTTVIHSTLEEGADVTPSHDFGAVEPSGDEALKEADTYISYGVYPQAIDTLEKAIAESPDNNDYRIKLAETYFVAKNASKFEETATELQARISASDPVAWQKIMTMGQQLCAGSALFATATVAAEPAEITPPVEEVAPVAEPEPIPNELEFDLSEAGAVEAQPISENIEAQVSDEVEPIADLEPPVAEETENDFSLDVEEIAEIEDLSADFSEDIVDQDFGIDELEDDTAAVTDEATVDFSEDALEDLDFGLDDDEQESESIAETDLDEDLEDQDSLSLDFDSETIDDDDDFDLSSLDDVDEVATKLDLARAYLDMGDHDGTRDILEEVNQEGTQEQKEEANELMARLN